MLMTRLRVHNETTSQISCRYIRICMYVAAHKYMDIGPLCMIQSQRPSQIVHKVSDESSFPTTGRSAMQSRGEIAVALDIQTRRLKRFLYVGRHPIHPPLAFHWTNCQSSFHIISELALSTVQPDLYFHLSP